MLLDCRDSAWALRGFALDALCQEPGCNRAQNHSEAKYDRAIAIESKMLPKEDPLFVGPANHKVLSKRLFWRVNPLKSKVSALHCCLCF